MQCRNTIKISLGTFPIELNGVQGSEEICKLGNKESKKEKKKEEGFELKGKPNVSPLQVMKVHGRCGCKGPHINSHGTRKR